MHMDMPAQRNIVLIDYENVQPCSLKGLVAPGFKVIVFVGSAQTKIHIDVAEAIHALGSHGCYVRCKGQGPNALDFHIAFHVGELLSSDSKARIHIISKDTGYDPLIAYLRGRQFAVSRSVSIEALPMFRSAAASTPVAAKPQAKTTAKPMSGQECLKYVHGWLVKVGSKRPASIKSLGNALAGHVPQERIPGVIAELQHRKWMVVAGGKLRYQLGKFSA
ncbi:hypothetical protein C1933_04885 [Stenotrophomonas sp. ZAC14D2_NAIMI4_6]|nr:hypothetical protein C1933_04885 [Stenotrophomonas sp. ZAC14D2_NAIMI4_6]